MTCYNVFPNASAVAAFIATYTSQFASYAAVDPSETKVQNVWWQNMSECSIEKSYTVHCSDAISDVSKLRA